MDYVPRVGTIIVTTLTKANTWYQVLTKAQAANIRGFKIKSRYTYGAQLAAPFDYAFSETPGNNYWSNNGAGAGDNAAPNTGVWARSAVAGTVIEVMTYD